MKVPLDLFTAEHGATWRYDSGVDNCCSPNPTQVAVKMLKCQSLTQDTIRDFKQEVDVMSKLSDENVVRWHGACTAPGNLCMVTEFMEKGSLHHVLHKV